MVHRISKANDGFYHVNGQKFEVLEGSRAKVWHGTAYKTSGGLTKKDLAQNKWGKIVSAKKSKTAKTEKRLEKHGWTAKKGKFGAVKKSSSSKSKTRKSK
tara:strand:- start:2154 stop:2453 length:300 start_codon:yes stop_codon:yes gene_type:complete